MEVESLHVSTLVILDETETDVLLLRFQVDYDADPGLEPGHGIGNPRGLVTGSSR